MPVEGEDGEDSSRSLIEEMPPFDKIVKVAVLGRKGRVL